MSNKTMRSAEDVRDLLEQIIAMGQRPGVDQAEFLDGLHFLMEDIERMSQETCEAMQLASKGALNLGGELTEPGMILWNSLHNHRDEAKLKQVPYYLVEEVNGRISATEVTYDNRTASEGAKWVPVLELEESLRGDNKSALANAETLLAQLDNGWI